MESANHSALQDESFDFSQINVVRESESSSRDSPCQPLKKRPNGLLEQGLHYGLSPGEMNLTLKFGKNGRHTKIATYLKHLVADTSF